MNSTTFTTTDVSSTDLSTSLSVLSNTLANESNPEHARTVIEKQQLLHQCEMMKIEIGQKQQQIMDLRAQHEARVEELEEQLHASKHTERVLQFRLNSAVEGHSKELKTAQDANSDQITALRRKQAEIEDLLPGLQVKAAEIRNTLLNLHVTEQLYGTLTSKPRESLTVKELIQVSFYERQLPHLRRAEELGEKVRSLTEQHELTRQEVKLLEGQVVVEKQGRVEVEAENAALRQKIELLSHQLDPAHKANYKNVLAKNVELEETNRHLLTSTTYLKAELSALKEEASKADAVASSQRQEAALLQQDKAYLSKENAELTSRTHRAEERLENMALELEGAKRARDKVYEELVTVRQDVSRDSDARIQGELDLLKQKTATELDHLRLTAQKVYEQEKAVLVKSREAAVQDRDEALRRNRDLLEQHSDLTSTYHTYQSKSESQLSEYRNTLKIKEFELERLTLLYDELGSKFSAASTDNEKNTKKLELLLEEYNALKNDHLTEVNGLTLRVRCLTSELSALRTGETDIKEVLSVLGSADSSTCSRDQLARRLVEISRNNETLKETLRCKGEALERALREVEGLRSELHHSAQPSGYLIGSIKKRDEQIGRLQEELERMKGSCEELRGERKGLAAERDQLVVDLEKALKNSERLKDLRQRVEKKIHMTERIQPRPVVFTKEKVLS